MVSCTEETNLGKFSKNRWVSVKLRSVATNDTWFMQGGDGALWPICSISWEPGSRAQLWFFDFWCVHHVCQQSRGAHNIPSGAFTPISFIGWLVGHFQAFTNTAVAKLCRVAIKTCTQLCFVDLSCLHTDMHQTFIVFRLIIEYSSLRDFGPLGNNNNNNNRSIYFYTRIFERWYFAWLVLKLEI
jgi:hypothetical protein